MKFLNPWYQGDKKKSSNKKEEKAKEEAEEGKEDTDKEEKEKEGEEEEEDVSINGIKPLHYMKEQKVYLFGGYKLKRTFGVEYYCTCKAWQFQSKSTCRTCKH